MANKFGQFTLGTTGTVSLSGLGFDATELEFEVGGKNGASSSVTDASGAVDSVGTQFCKIGYFDGVNRTSNVYSDKCMVVWEHTGGTWVKALEFAFNSYKTDGFKLDVTVANTAYPVKFKARNT